LSPGKTLQGNDIDMIDFSRILTKMPQRNNKDVINQIVGKLFDIASAKMNDEHDKAVLEGLRKYINIVEDDLLIPKPRYLDAFFFPNEKNIDRLVSYLSKA
jgi:hypothetical protein